MFYAIMPSYYFLCQMKCHKNASQNGVPFLVRGSPAHTCTHSVFYYGDRLCFLCTSVCSPVVCVMVYIFAMKLALVLCVIVAVTGSQSVSKNAALGELGR